MRNPLKAIAPSSRSLSIAHSRRWLMVMSISSVESQNRAETKIHQSARSPCADNDELSVVFDNTSSRARDVPERKPGVGAGPAVTEKSSTGPCFTIVSRGLVQRLRRSGTALGLELFTWPKMPTDLVGFGVTSSESPVRKSTGNSSGSRLGCTRVRVCSVRTNPHGRRSPVLAEHATANTAPGSNPKTSRPPRSKSLNVLGVPQSPQRFDGLAADADEAGGGQFFELGAEGFGQLGRPVADG